MGSITYSQSFIEALERRGIEHVFANSGTDHAPIVEALTSMHNAGNPTPAFLVSDALDIPITIVVSNNGMWYAVEQSTVDIYPDGASASEDKLPLTQFGSSPDYAALAIACGAHGETVTNPVKLESAMLRCLEQNGEGKAALLNVVTEPGTR